MFIDVFPFGLPNGLSDQTAESWPCFAASLKSSIASSDELLDQRGNPWWIISANLVVLPDSDFLVWS